MGNLTLCTVLAALVLSSASYGLKCRSEDEKNNDEFAEIAKMCLSNMSNWDNPRTNNNRDYNNGRRNDNRHYSNRDSYEGNRDNSRDGIFSKNNRDYNYNGGNGNSYGLWRKEQNSGGYGFSDGYSDTQQNPYYNPRSGIRSRGNQDRNNQRKSSSNSDNSKKNNNTNSTLEFDESSPLEKVEACVIHCIFQEMHMLDDSAYPDKSMVTKVMTKRIRDPKVKDFIEESIDDCFELLETDNKRSNCEYSKNLALCLEEKGQRNCDDWEDQNETKSSNNRNSRNPKRPN